MVIPRSTRLPSKKVLIGLLRPGSQTRLARAISATMRLIETTSLVASLVPLSPRMMPRSIASPIAGASRPRDTTRAIGVGQPQSKRSCQYANAVTMPIAPWEKLNIPVVA